MYFRLAYISEDRSSMKMRYKSLITFGYGDNKLCIQIQSTVFYPDILCMSVSVSGSGSVN
jgi:hypothetical protein